MTGPAVVNPGREETALVSTLDVFATVADLAGIDLSQVLPQGYRIDSVSMAPYLRDPGVRDLREFVYSEMFTPNGFAGPWMAQNYAIRNDRFKLVVQDVGSGGPLYDEFYDLALDPYEQNNIYATPGASPEVVRNYWTLKYQLERILKLP